MNTGALIIASRNLDSADRGNEDISMFLPMLHLDGTTVIKREIFTLRKAGISPIIVLGGYQKEILKNHLSHNGVVFCEDPLYESHSLEEAVQVGLEFAGKLCERVLIIPVECPAFSAKTAELLSGCTESTRLVYNGHFSGQDFEETDRMECPEGQAGESMVRVHVFDRREESKPENKGRLEHSESCSYPFLEVEDEGILYSLTEKNGITQIREYVKRQRDSNRLQVKTKLILAREEDFFGPGVYHLLQKIDETGSIQAAAASMKMSYSKCWKMINHAEEQMGFPFLNRVNGGKKGGSSTVTEEGRLFMERYNALQEDIKRITRNFFDQYFQDFQ